MAGRIYLELTVDGVRVEGEPENAPPGREDDIECLYLEASVALALAAGSTTVTGRRRHKPIVVRKRIDRSTPLLANALVQNRRVTAVFRFFRADPASGQAEHYYTIEIREARVASFKQISPDAFDPASSNFPDLDEVSFAFQRITWRYEGPLVEAEDRVGEH